MSWYVRGVRNLVLGVSRKVRGLKVIKFECYKVGRCYCCLNSVYLLKADKTHTLTRLDFDSTRASTWRARLDSRHMRHRATPLVKANRERPIHVSSVWLVPYATYWINKNSIAQCITRTHVRSVSHCRSMIQGRIQRSVMGEGAELWSIFFA